ncbi:hypothetical protein [Halalkalibacterium halodurans]|uniref:hypothetical protein n=1 Tax=Halalkalibacterium halodurans TaxID=86665 RepID=UPI002AAA2B6B|nr:hypothetical protein [Halalkalibacterium halodurans]MDY7222098.1 hypothetical protein [Halalkalibacterium halodurans]MDY7243883.1 hypothetical protein [Halalkalibacterium halodurans]
MKEKGAEKLKKFFGLIALIVLLVGCRNDFSEDLYDDSNQVQAMIFVENILERPLSGEYLSVIEQYRDKYSDGLNRDEESLYQETLKTVEMYESLRSEDGVKLSSDEITQEEFDQQFEVLLETIRTMSDRYNIIRGPEEGLEVEVD